jgi:hypothetical protein
MVRFTGSIPLRSLLLSSKLSHQLEIVYELTHLLAARRYSGGAWLSPF